MELLRRCGRGARLVGRRRAPQRDGQRLERLRRVEERPPRGLPHARAQLLRQRVGLVVGVVGPDRQHVHRRRVRARSFGPGEARREDGECGAHAHEGRRERPGRDSSRESWHQGNAGASRTAKVDAKIAPPYRAGRWPLARDAGPSSMRITGGKYRSRALRAPRGKATRPTSDRVREALFGILESAQVVKDARVLDLYAGTGALGLEALSRGAARVTAVESSREALDRPARQRRGAARSGPRWVRAAADVSRAGARPQRLGRSTSSWPIHRGRSSTSGAAPIAIAGTLGRGERSRPGSLGGSRAFRPQRSSGRGSAGGPGRPRDPPVRRHGPYVLQTGYTRTAFALNMDRPRPE